jgi:2-desacetyl-2-hydroxyethyl bacteriochlorophyllide A dehydrogenase
VQGLVFEGGRRVSSREFPDPAPAADEVVLRIKASGMCGSDLHYYRADPDTDPLNAAHIGGHEPAGVIEALGSGGSRTDFTVGDRVMVHHYAGCGRCVSCRSGWTQMCSTRAPVVYGKNAHGAHAPFMTVAAASVMPLDDSLSFAAGATIGCGTGTAWGALERLGEVGGSRLVVFGQGPVGLSATMLATARGARVIAVDPSAERRRQALKLGAAEAIAPDGRDTVRAVLDMTGGHGAHAVVETSGTTAAADTALEVLAPWGRLCVVGLGGTVSIDVRKLLPRQYTVMTSWSMSHVQQIACADFIAREALPVDELITDQWSIDDAGQAYAEFDRQTGGKGVFLF